MWNVLFHDTLKEFNCLLMSHKRLSQLTESKRLLAVSETTNLYRQSFLALALAKWLVNFPFSVHCIPLWADTPRGGITAQYHDDINEVS